MADDSAVLPKGSICRKCTALLANDPGKCAACGAEQPKDFALGEQIERTHAGCGGTFRILNSFVRCERCGEPYSACTVNDAVQAKGVPDSVLSLISFGLQFVHLREDEDCGERCMHCKAERAAADMGVRIIS